MTCILRCALAASFLSCGTQLHQVNTTVQKLNLWGNNVGADGASALAAALQAAFVLRTVCCLCLTRSSQREPLPCHIRKAPMCLSFRFGLIRASRLSIHHRTLGDLRVLYRNKQLKTSQDFLMRWRKWAQMTISTSKQIFP